MSRPDDTRQNAKTLPWPRIEQPSNCWYHARFLKTELTLSPQTVTLAPRARLNWWHWLWLIVAIVVATIFVWLPFRMATSATNPWEKLWLVAFGLVMIVPASIAVIGSFALPRVAVRDGVREETVFIFHNATCEFEFPSLNRIVPQRDIEAFYHVTGWFVLPWTGDTKRHYLAHQIFVTLRGNDGNPLLIRTSGIDAAKTLEEAVENWKIPVRRYVLNKEDAALIRGFSTF